MTSGEVIVRSLYSEDKGKGHARRVLELITEYADRESLTLRLKAHRFGVGVSPDDDQLVAIYSKHGFVIDESYKEFTPPRMIRKPQRKKGNE